MAVKPTLPNYKSFTFGGANSRTYGVYITGEGVFNAPERNVEMVEIPGRNGAYALDKGNFNNIEVTYPAGIFADNETDFAQAVSDFRNLLCSQTGYVRLEDDYNPNEYRMAIYKSGLEVSHDMLTNGEFDITFECKPQRFLTSGETAVSVASGGTLTNPTLFDSQPLLALKGYGLAYINGGLVSLENKLMGTIILNNGTSFTNHWEVYKYPLINATSVLNDGDTIFIDSFKGVFQYRPKQSQSIRFASASITSNTEHPTGIDYSATITKNTSSLVEITIEMRNISFLFNTNTDYVSVRSTVSFTDSTGTTTSKNIRLDVNYYNQSYAPTYYDTITPDCAAGSLTWADSSYIATFTDIMGDSTVSLLGNPTYVDCETGETYKIVNGETIGINAYAILGAKLPTLASGSNTITYDNTYTEVKVVPRWWKV